LKTVHVWVTGSVQDVGFRYFTNRNAKELGIKGWIRNTEDGKVEAVFQGDENNIQRMIELCRHGPSSSHVKDIKIVESDENKIYDDFSIRY